MKTLVTLGAIVLYTAAALGIAVAVVIWAYMILMGWSEWGVFHTN